MRGALPTFFDMPSVPVQARLSLQCLHSVGNGIDFVAEDLERNLDRLPGLRYVKKAHHIRKRCHIFPSRSHFVTQYQRLNSWTFMIF